MKHVRDDEGRPLFEVPEEDLKLIDKRLFEENGNIYKIIDYINEELSQTDKPKNLLFMGDVGLGKTFISELIRKSIEQANLKVFWIESRTLWKQYVRLVGSNYSDKAESIEKLLSVGKRNILIIDDFGTEEREKQREIVKDILFDRYNLIKHNKAYITIVSTNLDFRQIARTYGKRIADRFLEVFTLINFKGKSMRRRNIKIIE